MARGRKRRGPPLQIAHTGLATPCHSCGFPITKGQRFTPIYGHVYHQRCWTALWEAERDR